MAGKSFDEILADADQLIRVWTANPTLSLGDVTLPMFQTKVTTFRATRAHTEDLRTQLTQSVNDGNAQADELLDLTVRGRGGAKAQFGRDSTQYEQLGGTRASDRKPPKRKGSGGSGTPKS
ncbi:MAG: hypothetical protein QOE96_1759 [Blastocatellia bacterium]|jgi:hypothetical protein|nr:hypothetical protein [Blastocatellia bacterium]